MRPCTNETHSLAHLQDLIPTLAGVYCLSLSKLVFNSRDRPKNIWLPKRMHLDKQPYKNQKKPTATL